MSTNTLDVRKELNTTTSTNSGSTLVPRDVTRLSNKYSTIQSSNSSSVIESSANYPESAQNSTLSRIPSSQYGDVPFDEFELQIQKLCHLLWPTPTSESTKPSAKRKRKRFMKALRKREATVPQAPCKPVQFVVEHMRGGGYNRVAGIKIVGQHDGIEAQMVLRVPRMGVPQSDQDVVNLQFVQEHLATVPTPEIIAHDFSSTNPLNSPYVIQKRIPGHDLESKVQSYPDLSHEQKLAFVREFCQILLSMQKIQHPWAGQINKGDNGFTVSPFEVQGETLIAERAEVIPFFKPRPFGVDDAPTPDDATDATDISDEQTPLHFLQVQFARWRTLELGLDPSDLWQPSIWQKLTVAAAEMWEAGCLDSDAYCLTHYDLDPRNIMVDIQPDDGNTLKITGIIDWDLACFAPDWVGCKPPMWIWNWLDGGSEDETKANDAPPTAEQQELKDLFDKLVGSVYAYSAYETHYRLAREMFKFARYGLGRCDWREDAERVLEEWKVYQPEFQAKLARFERELAEEGGDAAAECGEDAGSEQGDGDDGSSETEDKE